MIKIYNMDVLEALKQLPSESVDMQITSPPYWGLRDYGKEVETIWDGDESCEHNFEGYEQKQHLGRGEKDQGFMQYIKGDDVPDKIVKLANCIKCGAWKGQLGLEPDFNLYIKHLCDIFDEVKRVLKKDGTCWVNLGDTYYTKSGSGFLNDNITGNKADYQYGLTRANELCRGRGLLPSKCLTCIPERFILGMIARGWILRNKIIWHKPNHMPTSVKDRFANSWEYLYLFSKSKKYYFDLDAVREPHKELSIERTKHKWNGHREPLSSWQGMDMKKMCHPKGKNPDDVMSYNELLGISPTGFHGGNDYHPLGKNPADFWDITTQPFSEAHFAVFPEALVKRPIKTTKKDAVILDIFVGSGTTCKVARDLGRDSIGIEINPKYIEIIKKRLFKGNQPLVNDFKVIKEKDK